MVVTAPLSTPDVLNMAHRCLHAFFSKCHAKLQARMTEGACLVEGHDEGRLALLEQVDGLDGLRLQAMHDVHHQDGNVAEAATARAQVCERLVPCRHSNPSLAPAQAVLISTSDHYRLNKLQPECMLLVNLHRPC